MAAVVYYVVVTSLVALADAQVDAANQPAPEVVVTRPVPAAVAIQLARVDAAKTASLIRTTVAKADLV